MNRMIPAGAVAVAASAFLAGGTSGLLPTTAAASAAPGQVAVNIRAADRHSSHLPKLSGFGDSVMLGAKQDMLHAFGGQVNAVESRQADPTFDAAIHAAREHRLKTLVVVHVGTNGTVAADPLKHALQVLTHAAGVHRVLVLTDHCARPWRRPNNRVIEQVTPQVRHAVAVNWNHAADRHPGWLYSDGIHLTPKGAAGYTRLLERHA